jgi:hypothetical protein
MGSGGVAPRVLNLVLSVGEWLASCVDRLSPLVRAHGTCWLCGWMGRSADLHALRKRHLLPQRGIELQFWGRQWCSLVAKLMNEFTLHGGILPVVDYGIRGFPLICWCANCDTWFCVCTHGISQRLFAPRCAVDGAVMAPEAVSKVPGNHWEFFRARLCVICEPCTWIFLCLVCEQIPLAVSSSSNDRDAPNPQLSKGFGAAGWGIFSNATGTLGQRLVYLECWSRLWLFVSGVLERGILLYQWHCNWVGTAADSIRCTGLTAS